MKDHGDSLRARLNYGELLLDSGRKNEAAEQFEAFLAKYTKDDEQRRKVAGLLERARAK